MTDEIKHPVIYILINDSLNMSPGKAAAQTAHVMASLKKFHGHQFTKFADAPVRTVIVLAAKNQQQMENLEEYLYQLDIPSGSYIDEGINEVDSYSETAMAAGPISWDDWEKRDIFKSFELYGKKKKKGFVKRLWQKLTRN